MMRLAPKQQQFIRESTRRLNIAEGSVRSGKTWATLFRFVAYLRDGPAEGDLLMIGKTERTVKRNIVSVLEQLFGTQYVRYNKGEGELRLFGRRIFVVGASDERAEQKIRGMTVAGAYCDEITTYPESFWAMLLSRLSVAGAKLFGTTNPDSPYHWFKTQYLDREADLNMLRMTFLLTDNDSLDPDYVAALKAEYTGLWYRRYILGQWVLAEGAVYDQWDETRHVIGEHPAAARYYVSVDYGTNNPTVFALFGTLGDRAWMEREFYYDAQRTGRQKTDQEFAQDLARFIGEVLPQAVIVDPSALSFKTQLRRDGFANVRDADNSVLDGIRTQSSMLSAGKYHVCAGCAETIKEYSGYVWDAKAQARGEDKPLKQSDHTKDAERYFLHTIFGRGTTRAVRSLY
jgi:PBSX family phage terminase large subunit